MYAQLEEAWQSLTAPGGQFEIVETEIRGQKLREYKNAPPTLRAVWQIAAAHAADANKEYLVYEDERWSYARAQREAASLANWLFEEGVVPGDRVAIALRNYPEWLLAYWACTSVGIAAVGVNAWWTGPELAYGIEDSDPKVIIADEERLSRLEAHPQAIGQRKLIGVRLDREREGVVPWSSTVSGSAPLPDVDVDPDADACIFYTSGTTGRPKGAQLTHRGCTNNLMSMAFANTVQGAAAAAAGREMTEWTDATSYPPSALVVTPLFHVTANNCVAQSMTLVGGKLVHMYKWEATEALRLIERERITAMSGVPVMARELITHPEFEKFDTSSLKTLAGGGAQVQPDLVHKIDESVKSARPGTGYGMTETCGIITSISADFFVDRADSCGRAMPSFATRVVDSDGRDCATGEVGELWVKGAQVIKGYLNRPDATAESITDGWLHTGDIARLDQDGFIYIVDRAKDMVLRGGENIYCAEVEAAIYEHPAVYEAAVYGIPDERLGEELACHVMVKEGRSLDPGELQQFVGERLARFKVPTTVNVVTEQLPRNASGKILKRELRDSFLAHSE